MGAIYETEYDYRGDHESLDPSDYAGGDWWQSLVYHFRETHGLSVNDDYTSDGSRKLMTNGHPSNGDAQ